MSRDRIEELEQKVERLTEELEDVKESKKEEDMEVSEIQDQVKDSAEDSEVSRRKFMKIAGGTAGIGAIAMLPNTAALDITSENGLSLSDPVSDSTNFEVDSSGQLDLAQLDTNSITVKNSITWPDGSTTTSSPSSDSGSYQNVPAGIIYIDSNNDYVAESFVTEEKWSDSNDATTVLQSALDAIRQARGQKNRMGEIAFGAGTFAFESPLVLDDHRGVTLTGQSFRQGAGQSGTHINAGDSLPAGRGVIELGDIGNANSSGDGQAFHLRNMRMNLRDRDVAGIYNWVQDRMRLTDCDLVKPGVNGNSVAVLGGFNCTFENVQSTQVAIVRNEVRSKDANSLRLVNSTFRMEHPSRSPLILHSNGTRISTCLFNGVDGPSLDNGKAIVSHDASNIGIIDADSRVSDSDVSGLMKKMNISSCAFVTGGTDVSVFKNLKQTQIAGSKLTSSGVTIDGFSGVSFSGCRFASGKEVFLHPGGNMGPSQISGCKFENYGRKNGEPAIRTQSQPGSNNQRLVVSGCYFRGRNGNSNSIEMGTNTTSYCIVGNQVEEPINVSFGTALLDSNRNQVPIVTNNGGHNPVGRSRTTPSRPNSTGSANSASNLNPQGAWVHHDGSGVVVNEFGTEHEYSVDTSPVFIPRGGQIYFENSVPSAWDWWWV